MPANLTPAYRKAEERFREATSPTEKIQALEEMLRVIPKHKGTDHLQADLRRRLAKLREASEQKQAKAGFDPYHIEKHGAGQVLVIGMANAGKSSLVGALTDANVHIAAFPFSTHAPVPGMMPYQDIQIQLVDMPPFLPDGLPAGMMGALRSADLLLVCIDGSALDLLDRAEATFRFMRERGLVPPGDALPEGCFSRPMIVLGTKCDVPDCIDDLETMAELEPDLPAVTPVSARTGQGLGDLPERCFVALDLVRVYSKVPGEEADMGEPFTLPRGSTVLDMARTVHRELAEDLEYARLWGSAKFDGQPVEQEHVLQDGDIVELHV